jgi:hypothetical protein
MRSVLKLAGLLFLIIPLNGEAALSDWYGIWDFSLTNPVNNPGDSISCTATITPGSATQATASASCTVNPNGGSLSIPSQFTLTTGDGTTAQMNFGLIVVASGITMKFSGSTSSGVTATCSLVLGGQVNGNTASGTWNVTNCSDSNGSSWAYSGPYTMTRTATYTPPATVTGTTPLPPPPTTQATYTVPTGKIADAAVAVSATGTYGSANLTVTIDATKVLLSSVSGQFAATGYNVYVAALVPGSVLGSPLPAWYIKPKEPATWGPLAGPIAAYMQGVDLNAANSKIVVQILTNTDVTNLRGSEIYIGYGLSDAEMLLSGRFRGVYKVQ